MFNTVTLCPRSPFHTNIRIVTLVTHVQHNFLEASFTRIYRLYSAALLGHFFRPAVTGQLCVWENWITAARSTVGKYKVSFAKSLFVKNFTPSETRYSQIFSAGIFFQVSIFFVGMIFNCGFHSEAGTPKTGTRWSEVGWRRIWAFATLNLF